jgi:PAS domain S-box-containing protein
MNLTTRLTPPYAETAAPDVAGKGFMLLSTAPSGREGRRLAFVLVSLSLLIFIAAVPFARMPLAPVWAFMPIYESALAISDLITAVLLFAQFTVLRSRALLILACGYLFTAVMAVPHTLTFPGLFAPAGLLGAGPQSTAWLYMFWHAAFPVAVIAYALLKDRDGDVQPLRASNGAAILIGIAGVFGLACVLTLLATLGQGALPAIMRGNSYSAAMIFVVTTVWLVTLASVVLLWRRRPQSVLDLWLIVVMCAWVFDVGLSAVVNGGRFDLGFYAGRIYGLLAATFVLLMLLLETGALYARLVRLFDAEHGERERVTKSLWESQVRQRAMFSSAFVGILTLDASGTIESLNPAAERLFGYPSDSLVRQDVGRLIDLGAPPGVSAAAHLANLLEAGRGIREFDARTRDGATFPIDLMLTEMPIGERRMFVVFVRNIAERRRTERLKDEFVATVSHELRTPLTSISGSLGLLTGGAAGALPDPVMRLIGIAQSNCQRLVRLINDILDIEKIESGKVIFHLQPVEVKSVVQQAIDANRAYADSFNVRVRLDADAVEATVWADTDRLMQVIVNLLSNAVKFSQPGEEVVVSIEPWKDHVRIAVRDSGPGIPDDFKARMFEKFAQVDSTNTRQKGGTGLGLSIVKQIVVRLGGEVGYECPPQGGTIFRVELPRSQAKTPARRIRQPAGT